MLCAECRSRLLPWLKRELTDLSTREVEQHVAVCKECASVAANEKAILEALRDRRRIPDSSPDFQSRVFSAATGQSRIGHGRVWRTTAVGGALAAVLVLGITLGIGLQPPESADKVAPSLAGKNAGQASPVARNLRLAFSSARALEDVTFTLELPPHIEMSRYPGHQQLSWKVDLEKGENIVNLPLNVLFAGQGDLVARIDDGERTQTFRADLSKAVQPDKQEPSS